MADLVGDVKRQTFAGVRSVIVLNLATVPLSFGTNMLLGRISPDALGYYSAVNVLISTYYTFCVFGGSLVFTRFTPRLDVRDRFPFLVTYAAIIVGLFVVLAVAAPTLTPGLVQLALSKLGDPGRVLTAGLLFVSIFWGFTTYFLYGTLRALWASVTEKAVVVGFFIAAMLGWALVHDRLAAAPSGYIWSTALVVHVVASVVGCVLVGRTEEFRQSGPLRWTLPVGFWPVVVYTHVATLVNYVFQTLAPFLVLISLDMESLGHLHAALRYVALLGFVSTAVASVVAPAMSKLEASGLREEGFAQAASAVRATLLLLVPAVLFLILLAGDAMSLFGPGFREHRVLLSILAASILTGPVVLCGAGIAAALGAFRGYVVASVAYVVVAMTLTLTLTMAFGLVGAAAAVTLGALVRQALLVVVLRRLGFPPIGRIWASWLSAAGATACALWLDPPRLAALGLWVLFLGVFALLGRVSLAELRRLSRQLTRRP